MPALIKPANDLKDILIQKALIALIAIPMICLFTSCTLIQKALPGKPLDMITANAVLNHILDQDSRVSTFYSLGTITVKDWKWDADADMLIVGRKDPFKIKIEITHQWKGPVLYILIDEKNLEVLSFSEKKLYLGPFTPEGLSKFIPGTFFDSGLIWSALRAYPYLLDHDRPMSYEKNSISLLNADNMEIEKIALHPENLYPEQISFPDHGLKLVFSTIRDNDGIRYAEDVTVKNVIGNPDLIIKNNKMVFNQPFPEKIFTLQRMPNYEVVYLEGDGG